MQQNPAEPESNSASVAFADVRAAAERIRGAVVDTPFTHSRTLSRLCQAEIFLKFENQQYTASFKERGALNTLLLLDDDARRRGVIAMSAGNHAQGVAYHARRLKIPATIVMPKHTPFIKVRHTRDFGAEVVLEGENVDEAFECARRLQSSRGLSFIHPYDDARIIAGQGTVGLEMLQARPELDDLVLPVGGGGLISGVATAARGLESPAKIHGVESELYPSLTLTLAGQNDERPAPDATGSTGAGDLQPIPGGATIAEGIAVKNIGRLPLAIVREFLNETLIVSESQIESAISLLAGIEKTVVEGAGAAGLAAVLANPELFRGRRVGLVLCGGNIDPRMLAGVLLRELAREGRIARLRVVISDTPGMLAQISGLVAAGGGNIISVTHQRVFAGVSVRQADLDLAIETRDAAHMREIEDRIRDAGFVVRRLDEARDA
ncbi:MAG: threonine ammonia-lyase [bacterium]|nr:threonine ammonia-lyase [bacterium]